jgi:molecular chaperone GrpE
MEKNDQKEESSMNEQTPAGNPVETAENLTETSEEGQENEILKLQNEISEQKDKYLRLYSEFENFRRRTSKERRELIESASEQVVKALLPVLDDFERAESAIKDKTQKEVEGFLLIQNKLKKVLDQTGLKAMDTQAGSEFNTDLHEAITQIPAPNEELKGKVVDVVEKGYLLNEKVIRFAKVVVGS